MLFILKKQSERMSLPKISIIIVNYNGKSLLEKCLESLFKVDYKNFEVILVDNNSSDGSIKFVTHYPHPITLIKLDSNKGFAEPNNIASKIAEGDYLLFLNNDTIVTPNFISEMVRTMENNDNIGICQSLLLTPDGNVDSSGDFIDTLGIVHNSKIKTGKIRKISSARGASMLIRKKIFEKLCGFDENFFVSFEDVDLGWRSWILGYEVVMIPTSIVYHHGGTTIKKIKSEIAFHGFKNQISMKITNFESKLILKKLVMFFIVYGFRELRIWFDYTLKGKTTLTATIYEKNIAEKPSMKIIFKALLWNIRNLSYLYKKHKKVNVKRKITTQELVNRNVFTNY